MSEKEKQEIQFSIGLSLGMVKDHLGRSEGEADEEESSTQISIEDQESVTAPNILCTSLRGAKGLSAGYVFMVGFNNGHFPENPTGVTDDDVCRLIVGLSRTRKQCQIVSCGRFGKEPLEPSIFLQWIRKRISSHRVDAAYFRSLGT